MFTQQARSSSEAALQASPSAHKTKHLGETQQFLGKGECSQMIIVHFFTLPDDLPRPKSYPTGIYFLPLPKIPSWTLHMLCVSLALLKQGS